jgi:hypothetical protein
MLWETQALLLLVLLLLPVRYQVRYQVLLPA